MHLRKDVGVIDKTVSVTASTHFYFSSKAIPLGTVSHRGLAIAMLR